MEGFIEFNEVGRLYNINQGVLRQTCIKHGYFHISTRDPGDNATYKKLMLKPSFKLQNPDFCYKHFRDGVFTIRNTKDEPIAVYKLWVSEEFIEIILDHIKKDEKITKNCSSVASILKMIEEENGGGTDGNVER